MNYLENNICKLTPLFDIDFNKKINIISTCFFKMDNSKDKDSSIYLNNLKKLNYEIDKIKIDYKIRLFIDNSIFLDKKLYNKIEKLKNVQVVLYSCSNFIFDDKYRIDIFVNLIRFFPFFDLPQNDANIVVSVDVENTDLSIITKYLKLLKEKSPSVYNNFYLLKSGILNENLIYEYKSIYKDKLNPYVSSLNYASAKRINSSVIIDYLKYNNKIEDLRDINKHFINNVLSKYIIDNKLCYIINTKWNVFDCLYYVLLNNFDKEKEKKLVGYIFNYISMVLKLEINANLTIYEKFEILDNIINSDNSKMNKQKYEINRVFYKIFLYLKSNDNYKFIFPKEFYKLFVDDNNFFGIYEVDFIRIMNCQQDDFDIIVYQNKLNNDDIIKLKKFYKKHKNFNKNLSREHRDFTKKNNKLSCDIQFKKNFSSQENVYVNIFNFKDGEYIIKKENYKNKYKLSEFLFHIKFDKLINKTCFKEFISLPIKIIDCGNNVLYQYVKLNYDYDKSILEKISYKKWLGYTIEICLTLYYLNNVLKIYHNDLIYLENFRNIMIDYNNKFIELKIDSFEYSTNHNHIVIIDFGHSSPKPKLRTMFFYYNKYKKVSHEYKYISEVFIMYYYFYKFYNKINDKWDEMYDDLYIKFEKDAIDLKNFDTNIIKSLYQLYVNAN